jgi:hypothetical protein
LECYYQTLFQIILPRRSGRRQKDFFKNIILPHRCRFPSRKSLNLKIFAERFEQLETVVMLRQAREEAGLTQEEPARQLKTKKTAIQESRITRKTSNTPPWSGSPEPRENTSTSASRVFPVIPANRLSNKWV